MDYLIPPMRLTPQEKFDQIVELLMKKSSYLDGFKTIPLSVSKDEFAEEVELWEHSIYSPYMGALDGMDDFLDGVCHDHDWEERPLFRLETFKRCKVCGEVE